MWLLLLAPDLLPLDLLLLMMLAFTILDACHYFSCLGRPWYPKADYAKKRQVDLISRHATIASTTKTPITCAMKLWKTRIKYVGPRSHVVIEGKHIIFNFFSGHLLRKFWEKASFPPLTDHSWENSGGGTYGERVIIITRRLGIQFAFQESEEKLEPVNWKLLTE